MSEVIYDTEFGTVPIRRVAGSRYTRLRIGPAGDIRISMPKRAARSSAQRLLDSSRVSIRKTISELPKRKQWTHGDLIGATHRLELVADDNLMACKTSIKGSLATFRHNPKMDETEIQTALRGFVKKILRKQAEAYLPRRLRTLVDAHGFNYPQRIRFSAAKTRWGSCSSSGTLSFNVNLMNLPLELVDYVLIHELCHTRHMNHSQNFWKLVEICLPEYKARRREIKKFNPGL